MSGRTIILKGQTNGGSPPQASYQRKPRLRVSELRFEHWALVPLLLFLVVLVAYPLLDLVRMAFSTATPTNGGFRWNFSGLENLRTMLSDSLFGAALRNVFVFVIASTAIELALGTALAMLVERARWLSGVARNVLIWPAIVTPVAISATWWLILNPQFGLVNHFFAMFGLTPQTWLASPRWALPTLVVVDVWHWTPVVFLLVLAGLAGIDRTLYEAARVDGASGWRVFGSITLPLLAPTLLGAAMVRCVLGFKVFDEVYLLTSGGPGTATEVISSNIQRVFFQQFDMGYGSFLGLVVVIVLVLVLSAFAAARGLLGR
jgi:multiple sugar transport system permease protein